jgi:hypothetical protein
MTRLRVATDKDTITKPNPEFLRLPVMGAVELKMAPCLTGLHITMMVPSKTGLPAPLPQMFSRTVAEECIVHRWWEKLLGISLETKTRWVLNKWKKRLITQDKLMAKLGTEFPVPTVDLGTLGKL